MTFKKKIVIKYAKYLFKQEESSKMSDISLKDFMYSCI